MDLQRVSRFEDMVTVVATVISRKVCVFDVCHHVPFKTTHLATLETLVQILIHFLNAGIHIVHVPWKNRELRKHLAIPSDRGYAFFVVPVAMDWQRVSRFEDFWTHLALIVPRTVDVLNVIENVLLPSTSFVAHDANKQIFFHFPHTRFDIAWKWNASVGNFYQFSKCQLNWWQNSLVHIFPAQHVTLLFVVSWNVHIKSVLGVVFFSTVWAVIREPIREVDCLQVVLSVPSAGAVLHAESARETASIEFWQESVEVLGTLYRSRWNRTRDTKCPGGPLLQGEQLQRWTGWKWEGGRRKGLPLFPSAPPAVAIMA